MYELNICQGCYLYNTLKTMVFQISGSEGHIDNRGVRSILLYAILNYESAKIC